MSASTMGAPTSGDQRRRLAWEATLDRLELDVLAGARMTSNEGTGDLPHLPPWDQPDDLGPIPADLVERARDIHARQLDVRRQLGAAAAETRRQHAATERTPGGTYGSTSAPAAYLDVRA